MQTIRFHLDFISPYAYLAWTQIHALADRCGAVVEVAPVLFAGLLNHHGQKGPAEIPAKRRYVFKDTLRRAILLGVPVAPPSSHPFNPLLALRAVMAAPPDAKRALVDGLFAATWGRAAVKGIDRAEVVESVARDAGLDGAALVARAAAPDVKDALRRATEDAIAAGVFGVPSMQVGAEIFWGLDSFDLLEHHLRGEDPITPELLETLLAIPSSAQR